MTNRLLKTRLAFQNTENFLNSRADIDWDISSYLTQHILIILSAEIQQEVYRITEERCQNITDRNIRNFMSSTTRQLIRSVAKSDLSKFLNLFGEDTKRKFNDAIDERSITVYGSALTKRHEIAHTGTCSATFLELKETIECADIVLAGLVAALNN